MTAALRSNGEPDDDIHREPPSNHGKLLLDAGCIPADIRYLTHLGLLDEARENSEAVIDQFHDILTCQAGHPLKKPRSYRHQTRKKYLVTVKQKQPKANSNKTLTKLEHFQFR